MKKARRLSCSGKLWVGRRIETPTPAFFTFQICYFMLLPNMQCTCATSKTGQHP